MTKSSAEDFLSSLYRGGEDKTHRSFDTAVTRLIDAQGDEAVAGDQALQSLMIHYLTSDPRRAERGQDIAVVVAGIKARAVSAFTDAFPDADLDTLIKEAKAAGHKVEVLGRA